MVEMGLAMVVWAGVLRMRLGGVEGGMMRAGDIFVWMQQVEVVEVAWKKFFLIIVVRNIVSLGVVGIVFLRMDMLETTKGISWKATMILTFLVLAISIPGMVILSRNHMKLSLKGPLA